MTAGIHERGLRILPDRGPMRAMRRHTELRELPNHHPRFANREQP